MCQQMAARLPQIVVRFNPRGEQLTYTPLVGLHVLLAQLADRVPHHATTVAPFRSSASARKRARSNIRFSASARKRARSSDGIRRMIAATAFTAAATSSITS